MTQATDSNLVTRYVARFEKDKLAVHSAVFEKKPKSWRRASRGDWNDPFGWRTVYQGGTAPGFATAKEAVEFVLGRARERVESAKTALACAEHELAQIEPQAAELLK